MNAPLRPLDLLGHAPVPVRLRLRDGLAAVAARAGLRCAFPGGVDGGDPLAGLRFVRDPGAFPRMLLSAGGANVFNRRFHARHVEAGAFSAGQPAGAPQAFRDAGLIDGRGWIGVYAVAPFVWLVDRARLGSRPLPTRWADLAEPEYRGEVVIGGWRRPGTARWQHVNAFVLASMAFELGWGGFRRLLANLAPPMHSAVMPRVAGGDASTGAIYVLPWSLADMCPRRQRTAVIWPADGALAHPLWLTVQAAHAERLRPLTQHLFGPALADYLDANRYPSLAPGRQPALPAGARLRWPGWERIRHPGTAEAVKAVSAALNGELAARPAAGMRRCA